METSFHDYFIDKALEFKDYEWLKSLQKDKYEQLDKVIVSSKHNKTIEAMEDINNSYVIKEKDGIRNINTASDYDIKIAEIIELEKSSYKKGMIARYRDLNDYETCYLRGYFEGQKDNYTKGYYDGYEKGYSDGKKIPDNTIKDYFSSIKDLKETISKSTKKKWYEFWK